MVRMVIQECVSAKFPIVAFMAPPSRKRNQALMGLSALVLLLIPSNHFASSRHSVTNKSGFKTNRANLILNL
jgi:hypothetical protein